ncbi:hypothetical protein MTR67_000550 [Solanum verrucosum]|uniref:Uncharacterized protein n=1 Tax=Solanum verrucosum TaxID=315347 RepID=A0AAF0TBM1_SOLVR|nr:hypothetical protein MTR67_000550 [Solanum verrucosum]
MSSDGDGDRHRENLGVSRLNRLRRRSLGDRYILRILQDLFLLCQSASAMILIYLLFRLAIRRTRPLSASTPSPTGTSPQLSVMRLGDSSSEQSDAMAGTPPLTQRFVHPDVSPSSTAAPSATPHDTMSALAPGQKDRLGRVMIELDRSS